MLIHPKRVETAFFGDRFREVLGTFTRVDPPRASFRALIGAEAELVVIADDADAFAATVARTRRGSAAVVAPLPDREGTEQSRLRG